MKLERLVTLSPAPLIWSVDWALKTEAEQLYGGTKTLIAGWLSIRVIRNPSGFLGFVQGPAALAVMALILGFLMTAAWFSNPTNPMRCYGFACMIGGALGNLTDRLVRGYVVDFLELWRLPVFNLADLSIVVGMLLIVIDLYRKPVPDKNRSLIARK